MTRGSDGSLVGRFRAGQARLWIALLALLALPTLALAHTALLGATPGDGERLTAAPGALRLRFNEPIEAGLAQLSLTGPDGAPVRLGRPGNPPDSSRVLTATIEGGLLPGRYAVRWQVAGLDGHPVRGEFAFEIAPGAAGLPVDSGGAAQLQGAPPGGTPVDILPAERGFDAASPVYVAVRWLLFTGLLGVIGAVTFHLLVFTRAARRAGSVLARVLHPAGVRTARAGLWMSGILGLAVLLRLQAQAYALHGAAWAAEPGLATTLLFGTVWGRGWILQAGATLLAAVGFHRATRDRSAGWSIAAVAAVALAITPALSGHAAAAGSLAPAAILMDGLHVLGAGGWLGSLLLLVVVGIPATRGVGKVARAAAVAQLVKAFSAAALLCAAVVVATGLFAAWLHLRSLQALWESGYGGTLLIKLVLLALVFALGAFNWRRLAPALGSDVASLRLRRSAAVELAIGLLVLGVTASLVATPPPGIEPDARVEVDGERVNG